MASSIGPINVPQATPAPKGPTEVGYMLQDPSVEGAHVDTIKLNLTGDSRPTSDDYSLSVAVRPNREGTYVFDPKSEPDKFLPMTILANLQRGFTIFSQYCDQVPNTWATGQKHLVIHPDEGEDFNAFYNREEAQGIEPGVHFFHGPNPKTGEVVYSGSSGEVTAHEGGPGHALLDRFRPGYFSTWSPDPAAFHESFGDVSSMLVMLKDPAIVEQVANQTGGDLTKHNVVSDLGEQLGATINDYIESQGGPANYTGGKFVRTAINNFKWQDPDTLPENPSSPDQLSTEPHDWSRLWTGAVYEILGKMVNHNMQEGQDAKSAISNANEDMLKIYGKLISRTAPEGDFTYKQMATAMLRADSMTGGKWGGVISDVMRERQILPNTSERSLLAALPQGTKKVAMNFTGKESMFQGTGLDSLGNFKVETLKSGNAFSLDDDQGKTSQQLQKDLARLARQGKILFTTPDQKVTAKDLFNPKTREPYIGVVKWVDGQAELHRLAIA